MKNHRAGISDFHLIGLVAYSFRLANCKIQEGFEKTLAWA